MFKIGSDRKYNSNANIGGFGVGFKSGVLANAHTAIVFTKCAADKTYSAGIFSNEPYASRKRAANFFRLGFFLISLGGQAPHVRPMWALNTCGEPNEIELTAAQGLFYRSLLGTSGVGRRPSAGGR